MTGLKSFPSLLALPFFRALLIVGSLIALAFATTQVFRPSPIHSFPDSRNAVVASVGSHEITLHKFGTDRCALSLYR